VIRTPGVAVDDESFEFSQLLVPDAVYPQPSQPGCRVVEIFRIDISKIRTRMVHESLLEVVPHARAKTNGARSTPDMIS